MADKKRKTTKFKSPFKLNLGIVIFGLIFIYVFINVVISFTTERTLYYEVVSGSNSEYVSSTFTGIALRSEQIAYADTSGYIDYYVRETSRISKSTTLYSIDSTGNLNQLLLEANEDNKNLTEEDIETLKELLNDFSNNYNDMNFSEVYNFKSSVKGTVVDLVNMNSLEKKVKDSKNAFSINKSKLSGIVLYNVDNYETITKNSLNEALFDKSAYTLATFSSGEYIEAGTPIYKTIDDEKWSIAVKLSGAEAKKYKKTTGIKIKFLKDNLETTANFEIVKGNDGNKYGIITLYKYLVRYANDRFINVQILDDVTYGLKIPKSAITKKSFYTIPKRFGEEGGVSKDIAFNRRVEKDGEISNEFYYPTIAYSDENNYYVSTSLFDEGDILLGMDSNETYVIGNTQEFMGVYNINNGYTVFVIVKDMEEMDEYYIIDADTPYGLELYDRIVLDASTVEENQIIFQ